MAYLKATFGYLKDNFLRALAFCFLPALMLGLVSSPVSLIGLLFSEQLDRTVSFSEVFLTGTDLDKPYKLVVMILAFILYAICAAAYVGSVQHKMRYGHFYKFNAHNFFKLVNNNFLPVAKGMLSLMVLMELLGIVTTLFVFFWSKVVAIKAVTIVLCTITVILFVGLFLFGASMLILTIPNMTMRGFGLFKSIRLSWTTSINKFKNVALPVVIPIVIAYVPLVIVNAFHVNVLSQILDVLFYAFALMYYHVLMYVIFFDLENVEVADINENNYWG